MMIASPSVLGYAPLGLALGLSFCYGGLLDAVLLSGSLIVQNRHALSSLLDVQGAWKYAAYSAALFVGFQLVRLGFTTLDTHRWTGLGKAALFPCKTTHARLFPKRHAFTYSYLVVGIPVGWDGAAGGMVSSGVEEGASTFSRWFSFKRRTRKAWFNIDAADYLERGNRELGLRGKLDAFLRSQVSTFMPFWKFAINANQQGRGSFQIPSRIPCDGGEVSGLSFQPGVFLVSVRRR